MKPFLAAAAIGLLTLSACSSEADDAAPAGSTDTADSASATPDRASPAESAANRPEPVETLASGMTPGLWDLSLQISAIDAPDAPPVLRKAMEALKGSTQNFSHCLPADQAGRPDPTFFGNDSANDCSYDTFSQSGDFTTISMTCGASGGRRARTDMQGTLGETAFDLSMANEILNSPNGRIKLAGKLTGKRVGACEG